MINKEITKDNTQCVYAYGGVNQENSGSTKPCCKITNAGDRRGLTSKWNEDHDNHEWWTSLRYNLNNGIKDPRCNRCWDVEKSGMPSMRTDGAKLIVDGKISWHPWSYVDLKLGSKCNLMCNMCNPFSSSLLAKETWQNKDEKWLTRGKFTRDKLHKDMWEEYKSAGFTEELQWWQNPEYYEKLKSNAEHIRTLKFTGGEPTLIPQVHEVMDYMLETGHADHIEISITTNGTYKGTDLWEKMLHFKSAKINLSVDGTDANYNYIRYPHTWKQWTRNTKQMMLFASDIRIKYQFTVSVYNLFNIREFENWASKDGFVDSNKKLCSYQSNFVFNPPYQNVRYLPDDTIQRAVDYLEGGDKISRNTIKFILNEVPTQKELQWANLKHDTELKDRLRPKRPNWDSVDNNMLRLKDLFHGR